MIIDFINDRGLINKRVRLGRTDFMLIFKYNSEDGFWYFTVDGYITNKRVIEGRILFETDDGYLMPYGETGKTTFTQLEWIDV